MISRLNIFIYLIIFISTKQLYFSIPYVTSRQSSTVKHLINVEINRFPYQIDLTLLSSPDYIMNLQEASVLKTMVNSPDYRKNQESIFGIVQIRGSEKPDERLQFKKRLGYSIYYYLRDFFPKITWINLNNIKQIALKDKTPQMSQGAFNFGPFNSQSQILKKFMKYSKYMQKSIITFKGNTNDQNGQIIFGDFPIGFTVNENVFTTPLQFIGEDYWSVNTIELDVLRNNGKNIVTTQLFKEMTKFRLTISERTLILPQSSLQILKKTFPKCTQMLLPSQTNKKQYFACKDLDSNDLNSIKFNFKLKDSQLPLSIFLKDLILLENNDIIWFDILSDKDTFQLSESILRKYMVGIDYKQGYMMYSQLAQEPWMTKSLFIKIFLTGNAIIFVISLILVMMEKRIKDSMKIAIKQEFGFTEIQSPSKVNAYQLADASEEGFSQ